MCATPSGHAESAHDRGAKLFQEKGCSQCHSVNGIGGSKGPDLSAVGKRMKKPALQKQILQGGLNMPPFSEAISPQETHDLVEYLHKCKHTISVSSATGAR
jgi:ubiquinol-cytochrome c reductase cytochrome b subunit